MIKRFACLTVLAALLVSCTETPEKIADRVFDLASTQFVMLDSELGPEECPRTLAQDGSLVKTDIGWWCSGFFPGSLWLVYEHSGDEKYRTLADNHTARLEGLAFRKTDHDIGFQINCSYLNALRITGENKYMTMPELGARRLSDRFNPKVGAIRSWGDDSDSTFRVIVDNMMNLELLLSVSELDSSPMMMEIAQTHALTTMKNHFRPDYSSYHLVEYDTQTGNVIRKRTVQGYSDESMWARGEAWALYGYTMMYRKTLDSRFLTQAENIARLVMNRLPDDGIPYWDFDDQSVPDTYRDASAAAIMSSAFIQLYMLTGNRSYYRTADRQIRTLASDEYLSAPGENHGFLLKHCVGNLPGNSEVDVPLTYADYYFLEALRLYSK